MLATNARRYKKECSDVQAARYTITHNETQKMPVDVQNVL